MNQLGLNDLGFVNYPKRTRKAQFLAKMNQVASCSRLAALIEPYYPKPGNGRRLIELETILHIHFMQQWFAYTDPAVEEALHDILWQRNFADIATTVAPFPDEIAISGFHHLT